MILTVSSIFKRENKKKKNKGGKGVGWKDGRAGSYRNWAAQMKEMNRKITSRCSTSFLLSVPPPSLWTFLLFVLVLAQFSSIAQSRPTLCDPMDCSMPGLPSITNSRSLLKLMSIELVMPSHPLSSPSPPAPNPSQHQSLFQWVDSSHEVAKVLEFQL